MGVNKILDKPYNDFVIIGNGAVGNFLHSLLGDSFRLLTRHDELLISDRALIIIATKAYDLENILTKLNHDGSLDIILIQNGYLENVISSYKFNFFRLLIDFGIEKKKDVFTVHGSGSFYTNHHGIYQLLHQKASIQYSYDISCMLWKKLMTNAVINPITALYNIHNKDVHLYNALIEGIIEEGLLIANHRIPDPLTYNTLHDYVACVIEKTGNNRSSMLQDIEQKRKTEIEFINGALVRLGKVYGISTPTNLLLYNQIKKIEESYVC